VSKFGRERASFPAKMGRVSELGVGGKITMGTLLSRVHNTGTKTRDTVKN
jgi:hypothetical protein